MHTHVTKPQLVLLCSQSYVLLLRETRIRKVSRCFVESEFGEPRPPVAVLTLTYVFRLDVTCRGWIRRLPGIRILSSTGTPTFVSFHHEVCIGACDRGVLLQYVDGVQLLPAQRQRERGKTLMMCNTVALFFLCGGK
jgi:hypothetical protein